MRQPRSALWTFRFAGRTGTRAGGKPPERPDVPANKQGLVNRIKPGDLDHVRPWFGSMSADFAIMSF